MVALDSEENVENMMHKLFYKVVSNADKISMKCVYNRLESYV